MKKSIISAKIFPRRVAESAEKGQGRELKFRIYSASSAPLRELFSWCGFGCGWPRCEIRGSISLVAACRAMLLHYFATNAANASSPLRAGGFHD
jgi:hypothetical protein